MSANTNIVFFDGVCNLCNATVDILLRIDQRHEFKFASLQGEMAKELIPGLDQSNLGSIVYLSPSGKFEQSSAVLEILNDLGGLWTVFAVFRVIPKRWRDSIYRWIARNRYRCFGKRDTCRVATPSEMQRFLA
jgi:predicted DCC family thiol-disulfide oxidoreductase YuxK